MDGREAVIRGLGPAERFGIGVDSGDVCLDGLLQLLRRAMDTAPDLPLGEVGKESLDLIDPGRACGRQMNVPVRPFGEEGADRSGLVRGVVVHHEMNVEVAWHDAIDLAQEAQELFGAMARIALADDLARGDVERGKQRCRAVALVIVRAPLGLAGAHRQQGL